MPYKKSNIQYFFILVVLLSLFIRCEDDRKPFPYVYINETFDVPTELSNLAVGEYVIMEDYGYGGLIIYRAGRQSFHAFDRACTYRPEDKCLLEEDPEFGLMECPCCGSSFLLSDEGRVFNGPSSVPLKQYQAYYNPNANQLTVTN